MAAADHDADGISVPATAILSNLDVTHLDKGADHAGAATVETAIPDTLDSAQSSHPVNLADFDTDDDDLIEIKTLAQLTPSAAT